MRASAGAFFRFAARGRAQGGSFCASSSAAAARGCAASAFCEVFHGVNWRLSAVVRATVGGRRVCFGERRARLGRLVTCHFRIKRRTSVNIIWPCHVGRGRSSREGGRGGHCGNPFAIPERNARQFCNAQAPANRVTTLHCKPTVCETARYDDEGGTTAWTFFLGPALGDSVMRFPPRWFHCSSDS